MFHHHMLHLVVQVVVIQDIKEKVVQNVQIIIMLKEMQMEHLHVKHVQVVQVGIGARLLDQIH